eukprot:scaffold2054_cov85-Isochrysis_galbana.AAC.1
MRTHLMSLEMVNSSTAAMETGGRTACTAGRIAGEKTSPEAEHDRRASIVGDLSRRRRSESSFVFVRRVRPSAPPPAHRPPPSTTRAGGGGRKAPCSTPTAIHCDCRSASSARARPAIRPSTVADNRAARSAQHSRQVRRAHTTAHSAHTTPTSPLSHDHAIPGTHTHFAWMHLCFSDIGGYPGLVRGRQGRPRLRHLFEQRRHHILPPGVQLGSAHLRRPPLERDRLYFGVAGQHARPQHRIDARLYPDQ